MTSVNKLLYQNIPLVIKNFCTKFHDVNISSSKVIEGVESAPTCFFYLQKSPVLLGLMNQETGKALISRAFPISTTFNQKKSLRQSRRFQDVSLSCSICFEPFVTHKIKKSFNHEIDIGGNILIRKNNLDIKLILLMLITFPSVVRLSGYKFKNI